MKKKHTTKKNDFFLVLSSYFGKTPILINVTSGVQGNCNIQSTRIVHPKSYHIFLRYIDI